MSVNEDPWILRCPKCGDTSQHNQHPISLFTPPQCAECAENPWKEKQGAYERILHFTCQLCNTTYLTPKLEKEDVEYNLFD